MYGLALVYNAEIENWMDEEQMGSDDHKVEEDFFYKAQRLISPKSVYQLNWNYYLQNTKQDIQSGLRYAITQWEGEQNDVLVEFKRMRLSGTPDEDERILQIQLVIESILEYVCKTQYKFNDYDEIDDKELARLSEIFEREYYGYVTDTELVQAMDRLLNIFDATTPQENITDLHIASETIESTSTVERNQVKQCLDDESDEYY
ncbi:unnamed protein product [Rotaria sp. Silwood2]|nr:unnamed protein product [Rotaria sp. Silwood2]CAF3075520.1 unnamed protein product [Rotaria sp. Silwood2]CAF3397478.1 unnamed protein product [Rotaria sp. Silwood2]CAF4182912.1 unnamed protein product [Rotaria sp. Silwood2]CAF4303383.1 unnamed protein product [Rotaria sp. Silwood2]